MVMSGGSKSNDMMSSLSYSSPNPLSSSNVLISICISFSLPSPITLLPARKPISSGVG